MTKKFFPTGCVCWWLLASLTVWASGPEISFDRDVRPILASKCFHCHGPDSNTRQGDLRLDDAESLLRVAKASKGGTSEMAGRLTATDSDHQMPPPASKLELKPSELRLLMRWIESGARYEGHWAFQPPQRPTLPIVKEVVAVENEIDLFIVARLEREHLTLSPRANLEALIRRASLDLIGLPPTPDEIADVLQDQSPNAYEKLIDRLLGSAHYGQHMATYWLDAARYADTDGYQNDRLRYQHTWRDWVVMALNDDMPYDQFIIEQLAGDLLPGATLKQQIATGFCRNHRINSEDGSIPAEWQVEYVADRVDTVGTVFLGLTVGCARCHEHKYDPLSQKEYYRLFAFFNNVPEWGVGPNNGNSPPFIEVPSDWQRLPAELDRPIRPEPVKLRAARKEEGNGLKRPQAGNESTVMIMHDLAEPRPTYLLARGRYDLPDKTELLSPGVPASLSTEALENKFRNRLDLAKWLVDSKNPLTSRVAVNRIWQQFFGIGLVKTSENLGTQGDRPSHPELLDWLALEFINSGWDVKSLQRKIMTSSTYCQSSVVTKDLIERDPENRLLARGPRFRLPAFVIRDSALAISGLLVEQIGGPPVKPYMPADIWSSISNNKYEQGTGSDLFRRSLYTYWRRTIPPPTMVGFNSATREVCTVRTDRTNTPLQALTMLNNVVFVESARSLAARLLKELPSAAESSRLRQAFLIVNGRQPREVEMSLIEQAFQKFRTRFSANLSDAVQFLAIGEHKSDPSLDPVELASLAMVASLLMNLDEAITKE